MAQCRGIVICFQISIFELQKTAQISIFELQKTAHQQEA